LAAGALVVPGCVWADADPAVIIPASTIADAINRIFMVPPAACAIPFETILAGNACASTTIPRGTSGNEREMAHFLLTT
jgi:hypothetical protein